MSKSKRGAEAPAQPRREGASFSDNQYSVAEADPEAFSEPICIAYRWIVGNDAYAWLLTFTDSKRAILGRSPSLEAADEEIHDVARRLGYPAEVIPRAPSEAYGQPRPEEVARA